MANIDKKTVEYLLPTRIVACENCGDEGNLLLAKPMQIGLNEQTLTTIKPNGYVILDFARELCGGLRILTFVASGGEVRLRLGESVSETCSEIGEKGSTNDHTLRDTVTKLVNFSDMSFLESGFRFARIDNLGSGDILLKNVYARSVYRDIPYVGSFECSDERINNIYDTARATLHLNMQNMLWDGIKRDRLVWIGDTHPEMLGITCVWGSDECIEQALDFAKEQAPLPLFMNNYPTYSLWWILILKDYYVQNANIKYLTAQGDYLVGLIDLLNNLVDEDGTCHLAHYFLDWGSHQTSDEMGGVRGLFIWAINAAKYILNVLGNDLAAAEQLLAKLNKRIYPVEKFKQAKAMQVYAGQVSAIDAYDFLADGNAKGMSTFMSYYILSSIADSGHTDKAVSIMREYYGAMLDKGATTFWEDFNMDWVKGSSRIDELPLPGEKDIHGDYGAYCYKGFRHSLCHGWSCGVVPFLTHYVLGVKAVDVGCKCVEVKPNLCGLTSVSGVYPTPYGKIEINCYLENGEQIIKITAPKEIKIVR